MEATQYAQLQARLSEKESELASLVVSSHEEEGAELQRARARATELQVSEYAHRNM